MSRLHNSHFVRSIHKALNRRTANNIKKNVVKQGKRRAISRALRPKKEKEAIATWRLSLNRILCVLEVRSMDSVTVAEALTPPFRLNLDPANLQLFLALIMTARMSTPLLLAFIPVLQMSKPSPSLLPVTFQALTRSPRFQLKSRIPMP